MAEYVYMLVTLTGQLYMTDLKQAEAETKYIHFSVSQCTVTSYL